MFIRNGSSLEMLVCGCVDYEAFVCIHVLAYHTKLTKNIVDNICDTYRYSMPNVSHK